MKEKSYGHAIFFTHTELLPESKNAKKMKNNFGNIFKIFSENC